MRSPRFLRSPARLAGAALVAVGGVLLVTGVLAEDPPSPLLRVPPTLTTTTRPLVLPSVTTTVPSHDVEVFPGDDLAAMARAAPEGTTFLVRAGVHRGAQIEPRDDQVFIGEPGAVLDGSEVVTGFTADGEYWSLPGRTPSPANRRGRCIRRYEACVFADMLYFDGAPLLQVTDRSELASGRWLFDYDRATVYLADDPAGHVIEMSRIGHAFTGRASGVEIRGLVVRKYASPSQQGAIQTTGGTGWTVADCEVAYNHGIGIQLGEGSAATGNFVHHNGQLGLSARERNVVISDNEIAFNNIAGFDSTWEAGGAKFVRALDLTVTGNDVHDNDGPGLWSDQDTRGMVVAGNVVADNAGPGIRVELTVDAVVEGNIVEGNGTDWGPGISVASSGNVEVVGNQLADDNILAVQQDRGSGANGPRVVENLWVHDNVVAWSEGLTGLIVVDGGDGFYRDRNNRFDRNTYLSFPAGRPFHWLGRDRSAEQWQELGNDREGRFPVAG